MVPTKVPIRPDQPFEVSASNACRTLNTDNDHNARADQALEQRIRTSRSQEAAGARQTLQRRQATKTKHWDDLGRKDAVVVLRLAM